jgi:hypothetical protein
MLVSANRVFRKCESKNDEFGNGNNKNTVDRRME